MQLNNKTNMEDKNISEKESLEIISNMIRQTQNQTTATSGNTFIAWGLIMAAVAFFVSIDCNFLHLGICSWGYVLIPILGITYTFIAKSRQKKSGKAYVKTYIGDVISTIWECTFLVLTLFPIAMLLHADQYSSEALKYMLFLAMFIPAFASFITVKMLKVKATFYTQMALIFSLNFYAPIYDPESPNIVFALVSILSLVIPGYLINRKAKKDNI